MPEVYDVAIQIDSNASGAFAAAGDAAGSLEAQLHSLGAGAESSLGPVGAIGVETGASLDALGKSATEALARVGDSAEGATDTVRRLSESTDSASASMVSSVDATASALDSMGDAADAALGSTVSAAHSAESAIDSLGGAASNDLEHVAAEAEDAADAVSKIGSAAGGSLRKVGGAASGIIGTLRRVGTSGAKSLGDILGSATAVNSAMELGRKGMEIWNSTVGVAVEKSLEFRRAGDDTLKFFQDFQRETDLTKARIGDALLPVLRGLIETLDATTGGMSDFFAANQKLISSKLVEWISTVGKALINGVVRTVDLVVKAWKGWELVVDVVGAGLQKFFAMVATGLGAALEGVATLAGAAGFGDLAGKISDASATMAGFAESLERGASISIDAIGDTVAELDAMERKIDSIGKVAHTVLGEAVVRAQERVAKSVVGTTRSLEEQKAAAEALAKALEDAEKAEAEKAKKAAAAKTDSLATVGQDAVQSGVDAVIGSVTGAMGAMGTAIAGALSEGATGAVAAIAAGIIEQSEALQSMLSQVGELFGGLVAALEPLLRSIEPIVDIVTGLTSMLLGQLSPVFDALAAVIEPVTIAVGAIAPLLVQMAPVFLALEPALNVLAAVLEQVAKVMEVISVATIDVFKSVADIWNGMVRALAGILRDLGSIKIFGERPFSFLRDWGDDLADAATVSTAAMEDAKQAILLGRREMIDASIGIADTTRTMVDSAGDIADAMAETASSVSNVPSGIKLALRRFQSIEAEIPETALPGAAADMVASVLPPQTYNAATAVGQDAIDAAFAPLAPVNMRDAWTLSPDRIAEIDASFGRNMTVQTMLVAPTANLGAFVEAVGREADRVATASSGALAPPRHRQYTEADVPEGANLSMAMGMP